MVWKAKFVKFVDTIVYHLKKFDTKVMVERQDNKYDSNCKV